MTAVDNSDDLTARGDTAAALAERLESALLGKADEVRHFLAAVLSGGHVLLLDGSGVGKTTLAKSLAACLDVPYARVQGTVDLLPSDLTGVNVFDQGTGRWDFHHGPLSRSVVLVDEVNRMSPRTQSALLEAMAEGQVTVDGTTRPIPDPFIALATANPFGQAGTYPMVNGLVDRFAISLSFGLPGREAERSLLLGEHTAPSALGQTLNGQQLLSLRSRVAALHVAPAIVEYGLDLVDRVRQHGWLSPRASQALLATARGHAVMCGRGHVAPDDVRDIAPLVLGHRLAGSDGDVAASSEEVRRLVADVLPPRPGR